jgi:two-component system LytT family sensor kinase
MFRNLIKDELSFTDKFIMIIFFSILSILGNYLGIDVGMHALANTRPIGAIVGGYMAGPLVGMLIGAIAGMHRYSMGGFTALACAVSTIAEGLIGGIIGKYFKKSQFNILYSILAGVIAEMAQMIIILILSKPFKDAVMLEKIIALPMILINAVGVVIFINIIKDMRNEYAKITAIQSQKALNIAKRTISYMRKGLNKSTAENIAKIIYEISGIKGVFICSRDKLLTYYGDEFPENEINKIFYEYLKDPHCAVVSFNRGKSSNYFLLDPIFINGTELEGTIGLKLNSKKDIDEYFFQFSQELSSLLSTQIELYKLNKFAQEASVAEIKALRAQIHPHFLFNSLTTIASLCRTDALKARKLIIDLSNYFRITLKREEDYAPLKEEIEFICSYLSIEKARFGDRLKVNINIPEYMLDYNIPVFIIQPIIENSIKHGILNKPNGGVINLTAELEGDTIVYSIEDTGVGMSEERLDEIKTNWPGIGLRNVNERLKLLFGQNSCLQIDSKLGIGTKVRFTIPKGVEVIE